MKSIRIAAWLLFSTGALYAQDVTVQGNSRVNTDFDKYKTFSWAKTDNTAQAASGYDIYTYSTERGSPVGTREPKKTKDSKNTRYVYSYNVIVPSSNPSVNTTIQASIASELEGRGYTKSDEGSDLLVAYKILERPGRLKGYINDDPKTVGAKEVRQPSDTTSHRIEPGTLIISLLDSKTEEVVWQGFASGLYKENALVTDQQQLKSAVNLIFEKFKYRADNIKAMK